MLALFSQPKVSIAGEICVNHADGFYSYAAKYLESDQTELHVPAKLDEKITMTDYKKLAAEIFSTFKM